MSNFGMIPLFSVNSSLLGEGISILINMVSMVSISVGPYAVASTRFFYAHASLQHSCCNACFGPIAALKSLQVSCSLSTSILINLLYFAIPCHYLQHCHTRSRLFASGLYCSRCADRHTALPLLGVRDSATFLLLIVGSVFELVMFR